MRLLGLHYALASPLAIEASVLTNYLGNRAWTWRDRRVGWTSLLHFHGVSLLGMFVQWTVLLVAVEFFHVHYLLGSLGGILLGTAWNFVANHHFTFAAAESPVRRRLARPLLYASALLVQLVLAALFVHAWDGFVFERSVESFLRDGETPYETIEFAPEYVHNRAYTPPFPEWYAYPPLTLLLFAATSFPHVLFGIGPEWLHRVLWKLPIVAASLAVPWLARSLAHRYGAAPKTGDRLERLLLFNPLLLLIGPMWGMTEPILLAFLLGSLLALERGQLRTSAVLFGVSALVKIFPLFVYPVLLAHLFARGGGWRAPLTHATLAALTWLALSLPFYLLHPRGFIQLVFLMHVERPPAGFSVFVPIQEMSLYFGGHEAAARTGPLFSIIGLSLFAFFLLGTALRTASLRPSPRRLPLQLGLTYGAFLVLNKVVHEQYLLPLLVLLAVAAFSPVAEARALRRFAHGFSLLAAAASLLVGLRLIQFLPPDLAPQILGTTPSDYILRIRLALGWTHEFLVGVTGTFAVALVIAGSLPAWRLLRVQAAHAYGTLATLVPRIPFPAGTHPLRRSLQLGAVVGLLLVPTATVGVLTQDETERAPLEPLDDRLLGAYYYLWWENPGHDYGARYGNWRYATTTPLLGYYSSYPGEMESALRAMKAAGIDFALVPLQGYDHFAFTSLAYQAERVGVRFAPLFNLATIEARESRVLLLETPRLPLTPSTVDAIRDHIERYSSRAYLSTNLLGADALRPLVFLEGARFVGDASDRRERDHIADVVIRQQPAPLLTLAVGNDTWEAHPELLSPAHFATAQAPLLLARLWEEGRAQAYADAWDQILETLDRRIPGAQLVVAAQDLDAPGFPLARVVDTYDAWDTVRPGGDGRPLAPGFRTLYPQYNATRARPGDPLVPYASDTRLRYVEAWQAHLGDDRLLLHSWNEHQEGTAIEPTWERGPRFVDATARWSAAWRDKP